MVTPRFAHANIRVADPAAAVEFYGHLGFDLAGCLDISPGYALLYLSVPNVEDVTLELAVNQHADDSYSRAPGSGHIALAVGDLDALVERLAAVGITPEKPPFHPVDGRPLRVCFVVDPDGTRVELIEGEFPTPSDKIPEGIL
ncbi:MAG: VOC family protein [Mycobacterium sp.]